MSDIQIIDFKTAQGCIIECTIQRDNNTYTNWFKAKSQGKNGCVFLESQFGGFRGNLYLTAGEAFEAALQKIRDFLPPLTNNDTIVSCDNNVDVLICRAEEESIIQKLGFGYSFPVTVQNRVNPIC